VIIWLSLAQSLAFTLLAKPMVYLLYGEAYLPAVPVLRVITWQTAFSYMGTVRNVWILAEEKHSLLWRINLAGVCANVSLNALTIPVWGACGAAAASVLTQIITNLIVGFFMKPIRQNNRLLVAGLDPRWMIKLIFSKKRTNS
jgi:O-antigen/teichoic acid export membrane protein